MPTLRIINWNLNGAVAASNEQQRRAWHHLAALGADLALLQEVRTSAIPSWAREEWELHLDGSQKWGSVIAARPEFHLQQPEEQLEGQDWIDVAYRYLVVGQVTIPDGASALVASVHAVAEPLTKFLGWREQADLLSGNELDALARVKGSKVPPYTNDFIYAALERTTRGHRFFAGGDWNTSRLFDNFPDKWGPPVCAAFFQRAQAAGWHECHGGRPEERSYLKGPRPYQLDHLFCDRETGKRVTSCRVLADGVAREVSDHAPMVTEVEWARLPS